MLDRAACERRVYRLATLLTGDPRRAAGVIAAVVDAQPDLRRLDGAHMDRLTVLRSREIRPGVLHGVPEVSEEVAEALAGLPEQQREAWVFARVYRMETRDLSKAMDCSVTATQRHLELADEAMAGRLGVPTAAAVPARLLRYAMALDVPAFYRAARRRRRLLRRMVTALLIAALVAATIFVARHLAEVPEAEGPPALQPGKILLT